MVPTRTLTTPDGVMDVYVAEPAQPRGSGVIVIQEAFGVNHHIQSIADRLAAEGYVALAPALFHRSGSPILDYGDIPAAMQHLGVLTAAGLSVDLDATIAAFADYGITARQIGLIGFCMGGSVSFFAATRCPIGASVGFYRGGIAASRMGIPSLLELAPSVTVPWLGQYGDEDQGIPVEQVEQLREALASVGADTQIIRYPGAGHGFNCDERPAAYHRASAVAAWARALEWFDRHLARS